MPATTSRMSPLKISSEPADSREIGQNALCLHDLGHVEIDAQDRESLAPRVAQSDSQRLEDLAVAG
jgi:hypothetical protein